MLSKLRTLMTAFVALVYLYAGAQNSRTITGTVMDDENQPLIGAGVQLEGSKGTGSITDLDGNYKINVPSDQEKVVLVFSFLGMGNKSVSVAPGQKVVNVALQPDNTLEAAVIDAGYGLIQKKENLTGSAFQVNHESLTIKPAERIDNMLAGQVPGLNVIEETTNGRPSVKIRLRGDGSLSASSEPLWVIDGVPIYTGTKTNSVTGTSGTVSPLSFINPDDIESMTVLKDASTTSLYGADGANGVILVTTRSGKSGKSSYNVSIKYGISSIDRSTTIKYCNAQQWMELAKEGWVNSGRPEAAFPYQDNEYNSYSTTDTDWYKVYMGIGQTAQINFSATGGSDKMNNFFSLSYYTSTSPYKGNSKDRYSIRDKVTINFCDKVKLEANLSASYNHDDLFSLYSSYDEILPIFDPYNEDGSYRMYNYYSVDDNVYKPVAKKFYANKLPERQYNDNYQNALNADANILFSYEPIRGLKITSQTGLSLTAIYNATYSASNTLSGLSSEDLNGYSSRYGVFNKVFNENLRVNFNRTFKDRHAVMAMLGLELTDKTHPYLNVSGNGFINDQIKEIAYATASTIKGSSNTSHTRSLSYIGHFTYTYDRRYTLSLSARRQGYSSFSEYSRWGNFASIGATWNIHREHFFHSKVVDQLSAKVSYGSNGNSRIDTSSSYGSYSISTGNYYGGTPGANQSSPANPGLTWENMLITNVGTTIGLFNRLSLTLEYYHKRTKDLLYSGRVSSVITGDSVMRNVGEITNQGFEFDFNSTNISTKDFTWSMSINGARNRNKITKLYKGTYKGFFNSVWIEGASKDAWWLVRWAGVDPTNGAPMWYDANGDLTYTFSYDNRVLLPQYTKQPDLQGGVSNDFRFKDFSLRVMFDYTIGGWDYFYFLDYGSDVINSNQPVEMLDHWRKQGDVALHPRYAYKHGTQAGYNSTKCLYKMTSIQLRSLSFSYNLPRKYCEKIRMKGMSFSIIGDNLFFWSPGASRKHNSYKTLRFSDGMMRGVSAQVSMNF